MKYTYRYKLQLQTSTGERTLFEVYGKYEELDADFARREEWLVTDFPDAFRFRVDETCGKVHYYTPYACNDRPILRFIGICKPYKDKDGVEHPVEYQIIARILNFEYEEEKK